MLSQKGRMKAAPAAWLFGILFSFVIFIPIAIPMIKMDETLDHLIMIYIPALAVLSAVSVFIAREDVAWDLKNLFGVRGFFPLNIRERWPMFASLIITAAMAGIAMLFAHQDADDSEYVVMAVSSVQTNTLMRFNPYTGKKWKHLLFKRFIAPFPIWEAVQAKLTAFHPAVICHFLLPGIFVIASAAAVFLMMDAYFAIEHDEESDRRHKYPWIALLAVLVMMAYGNFSTRSMGAMILLRPWQGKALVCAVMLPLLFAMIIKQLTESMDISTFVIMVMIVCAGSLCSAVSNLLLPMAIGAASLIKFKNHGLKQAAIFLLTAAPALVFDICTVLFA